MAICLRCRKSKQTARFTSGVAGKIFVAASDGAYVLPVRLCTACAHTLTELAARARCAPGGQQSAAPSDPTAYMDDEPSGGPP